MDLKKDKGKVIVHGLVERSDIFIHNPRGSVPTTLGLDYETLSAHNPHLIYAHGSGWGTNGPGGNDPFFDLAALARSGFLAMIAEPGRDPAYPQDGIADQMGAITTALGILAAPCRGKIGVAQKVDASILGGMSFLLAFPQDGWRPRNMGLQKECRKSTIQRLLGVGDRRWMALVHVPPDKCWPPFCRAMGLEGLEDNPRFNSMDGRAKNCQ